MARCSFFTHQNKLIAYKVQNENNLESAFQDSLNYTIKDYFTSSWAGIGLPFFPFTVPVSRDDKYFTISIGNNETECPIVYMDSTTATAKPKIIKHKESNRFSIAFRL